MKILIISSVIGRTAPGIVFEKLLYGLSEHHEIDVLTSDYEPMMDLSKIQHVYKLDKIKIHTQIHKLLVALFSIDPFDYLWSYKAVNKIRRRDYDLIFSFISNYNYLGLIGGIIFNKKQNSKLAVLAVDGIPAPNGWPENRFYYKGVCKMIYKKLSFADAFFSTNEQMLNYQLSTFNKKENLIFDVVFNPGASDFVEYNHDYVINNFLYTGGIYGVRKINHLIKGFEMLLETYPDSKLIFVGTIISNNVLNRFPAKVLNQIEIHPFTKDLEPFYKQATALIDIDAEIENDVFISSKINNYLMINRIIISQTGSNSPSRHLFKNIESIIQCDHDSVQMFKAMQNAIIQRGKIQYSDRVNIVNKFKIKTVINKLNKSLLLLQNQ